MTRTPSAPSAQPRFRRLADRMREGAHVGRTRELKWVERGLRPDGPSVLVIYGPGGVGKSTLLDMVVRAQGGSHEIVRLECADVQPTPQDFVVTVAGLLGSRPTLSAVAEHCARSDRPVLLVLDTAEHLRILETWLRTSFFPALPETTTTLIASRYRPHPVWYAAPAWRGLLDMMALGPLDEEAATAMLTQRGLSPESAAGVQEYARGFPLLLDLAGAAADPGTAVVPRPGAEVAAQLVHRVLAGLPERQARLAEAVAVVRRVSEPLLMSLLDDEDLPGEAEERLWDEVAALPFVSHRDDGLVLHDVVRECLARELEHRDPERYAAYHRRAAQHLIARMRATGPTIPWRTTADLLFLVRNPLVHDAFFPRDARFVVEQARPQDERAVRSILTRQAAAVEDEIFTLWWRHHADAFTVARDEEGEAVAAGACIESSAVAAEVIAADPVAQAWEEHLRRHPLADGSRVLWARWAIGSDGSGEPGPEVAPVVVDFKRHYLQLHPALRRVYTATPSRRMLPLTEAIGFRTVAEVDVGGRRHVVTALEMPHSSLDGWLSGILDIEMRHHGQPVDPAEGPAQTRLSSLTDRELEVLRLVADGLSNRELAQRLVISEKTANRHVSNIFLKLDVANRALAARVAVECGLTSAS